MPRRTVMAALVAVPLVALVAVAAIEWWPRSPPEPLAAPQDPLLPDLAMSPLTDFAASVTPDGRRYLAFTASIGNVGAGPFIVYAVRGDERGAWRVSQRFRERHGPTSERVTPGTMVFGGHGHDHWHVRLGASYWLTRPGSNRILRRFSKVGYCFFDQVMLRERPAGASPIPTFGKDGCDGRTALELEMGLSPGFTDPYPWTLPDQRLPISGLPDGVYRLWATADPDGWFRESREDDNRSWVDLRLDVTARPPRVQVVDAGPAGASGWRR